MGSSFGCFLVVIGAAGAVLVTDLGDRGHVDRAVDPAVAAQRQAVDLAVPRRHLDRGGAVIGGEVIAAGKPDNVAGVADDGPGDDGALTALAAAGPVDIAAGTRWPTSCVIRCTTTPGR